MLQCLFVFLFVFYVHVHADIIPTFLFQRAGGFLSPSLRKRSSQTMGTQKPAVRPTTKNAAGETLNFLKNFGSRNFILFFSEALNHYKAVVLTIVHCFEACDTVAMATSAAQTETREDQK